MRLILLALFVIAVSTSAAYVVSLLRQPIYGAKVDILFPTDGYDSEAETNRALATQKVLVSSDPVLLPVADATGVPFRLLRKSVSVETVDDSDVLRITTRHASREVAYHLAQAVTARYMAVAREQLNIPSAGPPSVATRSIHGVASANGTTERQLQPEGHRDGLPAPHPGLIAGVEDVPSPDPDSSEISQELTPTASSILSPPRLLDEPLQPKPLQGAAFGFIIGSLLAIGTVFVIRTLQLRSLD